jgi:hypothetical protein
LARCASARRRAAGFNVGIGRARVDDVDGDAARPEIARQPLVEADQGHLAHRIERRSRLDDAVGQAGAGRDDPPAFPEMRGGRLRGEHDDADINRQRRIDIGEAPLGERAATPDAGIVDEDVESTLKALPDRQVLVTRSVSAYIVIIVILVRS